MRGAVSRQPSLTALTSWPGECRAPRTNGRIKACGAAMVRVTACAMVPKPVSAVSRRAWGGMKREYGAWPWPQVRDCPRNCRR